MKLLILGGNGMLGHHFYKSLRNDFDTKTTLREQYERYEYLKFFSKRDCFFGIDALNLNDIEQVIKFFKPDVVLNCIGITKKLINQSTEKLAYKINGEFPNRLSEICENNSAKLILLSTDCIFTGKKGNYSENDETDADDVYGRSKILGEVLKNNTLVIRKSTIGLELENKHGLIEWFISQKGEIKGFKKAIYSGITAIEFTRVLKNIILNHMNLSGIYNLSSSPISKYEILEYLKSQLNLSHIKIIPDNNFCCDRSLNMTKLYSEIKYISPSWKTMLDELILKIKIKYNF